MSNNNQQANALAQMAAASAQQQQQQQNSASQLGMQQMQAALTQIARSGNQAQLPWLTVSKYSIAEIRMAIGTKIMADNYKCKLIAVDEIQKLVTIDTGTFMSNKYQIQWWRVDEIPLIDNMYKTKLGRVCKS